MPCMYFSGKESEDITLDDPENDYIRINPELYAKVQLDNEQNARVFLDTYLLRIRDYMPEDMYAVEQEDRIVSRSDASVSLETRVFIPALVYVTNLMIVADFREMTSNEFKTTYLAPLNDALRESIIGDGYLLKRYAYPFGDATHVEGDIQRYFDEGIGGSINTLYREICGKYHKFGKPTIIRPPLDRRRIIKPDIAHISVDKSAPNLQNPEICFAIGDYEKKNYYLNQGFEELKMAIANYETDLSGQRTLRLQLTHTHTIFQDREWTPRVVCALVLRKYIYQALLCGTDRVFISDHQSFSGFFKYKFVDDEKMTIDYFVINDPETVEHGITLRSAIAGFFYEERKGALDTKQRLATTLQVVGKTKGSDPFENVVPRPVEEPSHDRKRSKLSGSALRSQLISIEENIEDVDFDVIHGNTYCRIIYDAPKCYPGLRYVLPISVFVKLYNYPDLAFENFPEKEDYYDMFVNELEINKIIANSQFASNFPKLIVSGYLNGIPSKPMHIFEDLGEELPISEWNYDKVYDVIKLRLEEIHVLGISHNDVRLSNIHVSVAGKISLIDFGLSACPSSKERKKGDFTDLDRIFRRPSYSNQNEDQGGQREMNCDASRKESNINRNYGYNEIKSSEDEGVFESISKESQGTEQTERSFFQRTGEK
ncbi:uncharacterized protein PRCAT00004287001 [Priceomyces carsonii]|uniref:uncharacterized protein n=1 Tax=Priceomyces carsonii TaxID=28549 RepID=UPI002ED84810|nr:unnamed protein product [Priceomyces carsonii]